MTKSRFHGVFFDLDGTLLDTYRDLAGALDTVLRSHGHDTVDANSLRPFVSRGALAMVCRATGLEPESETARQYWQEMLEAYEADTSSATVMFPGINRVLEFLEVRQVPWGIVTNKPGYLTQKLLRELDLGWNPGIVISGDSLPVKKPDPAPLLEACSRASVSPGKSVYIGDDRRDIEAGQRAGMGTIAVSYGYFPPGETPADWQADHLVDTAHGIVDLLTH